MHYACRRYLYFNSFRFRVNGYITYLWILPESGTESRYAQVEVAFFFLWPQDDVEPAQAGSCRIDSKLILRKLTSPLCISGLW